MSNDVQKVVICADHDRLSSNTKGNMIEAIKRYLSLGKKVLIAMPTEIPLGLNKCDFNDLLKQEGISSIKAVLNAGVEIKVLNY